MFSWLRSAFFPEAIGVPRLHTAFRPSDRPLPRDCARSPKAGWELRTRGRESIQLYSVARPEIEDCLVTFRAEVRTAHLAGTACLELAGRFAVGRSFARRGYQAPRDGDWHLCEVSHRLGPRQPLEALELSLFTTGPGTVGIRNAKVLVARRT